MHATSKLRCHSYKDAMTCFIFWALYYRIFQVSMHICVWSHYSCSYTSCGFNPTDAWFSTGCTLTTFCHSLHSVTVGGHSSCYWEPGRPSSAQWASPRLHHGAGDSVSPGGCQGLRKNQPESKPHGCASRCVWLSCRAALSLPSSLGAWPPRPAPSESPPSAGE